MVLTNTKPSDKSHWNKGSRWQFVYGKNITGGMKVRRNKKGRKSKRYHNFGSSCLD
jgi:hypothetical protein